MNSRITVRVATLSDIDLITDFNCAMAGETEGRALDRSTVSRGVRAVVENQRLGVYYVAASEGTVVGQMMITYEWSDWRCGLFWWIQSVYVAPAARGAGAYRALHQHVESLARSTPGVCGIRLYVEAENTAAQRVYEKLGMSRTSYQLYEADWPAKPA
ncbi:MAG: GNAT family N-acetyltransferase [Phycisphaerales bacterium]|nr:GNAT family N-acetyltransferase [Phycisphaerales bacterium]